MLFKHYLQADAVKFKQVLAYSGRMVNRREPHKKVQTKDHWKPLDPGRMKNNVNGSFVQATEEAGTRMMRNHVGKVMEASWKKHLRSILGLLDRSSICKDLTSKRH
jgi:hypothetical protein